ncbi:MAG: hypothetical protein HY649_08775 [Acidobacteria bacterium]|nr:hypothetical protein [Acidobacteriota bacterium]
MAPTLTFSGLAPAFLGLYQVNMQIPGTERVTLGGDKNYDTRDVVSTARGMRITPRVAQNDKRLGGSA